MTPAPESWRDIVERLPDGLAIVQDGRRVFANPAAATLLGFADPAAMVARSWSTPPFEDAWPSTWPPSPGAGTAIRWWSGRCAPRATTWQDRPAVLNPGLDGLAAVGGEADHLPSLVTQPPG